MVPEDCTIRGGAMPFVLNGGGICGGGVTPKHRAENLALNYESLQAEPVHIYKIQINTTHVKKTKHFDKQS